ncbi:MAG: PAS domain S-box protein [Deltaproteobacteria bacterium]|nr:PAS domain S-box protein [Deltaproteobacteria bacterium]
MVYLDLILNLSLLVSISIVSGFIEDRWSRHTRNGVLLQGVLFGGAAVIGMLRPLDLGHGLIFDGRSIMVGLCALYFGPRAMVVACIMTLGCRLWLGGVGMITGSLVILSSGGIGLAARFHLKPETEVPSWQHLLWFGLLVHGVMLALMLTLPGGAGLTVIRRIGLPVILLYPLATILAGKILSDQLEGKQVLKALRESERRYIAAQHIAQMGDFTWDVKTGAVTCSEALFDLVGYHKSEIVDYNLVENQIHHPDDVEQVRKWLNDSVTSGKGALPPKEYRLVRKDGQIIYVRTVGVVHYQDGKPAQVFGTVQDISERKQAEEALIRERRRFQQILDAFPYGIYIVDKHHQIEYVNNALRQEFGDPGSLRCHEYFHDLPEPCSWCRNETVFQGEIVRWDWHVPGSGRDYELVDIPLKNEDGTISKLEVFHDMTDRKHAEEDLLKRNQFIETILDHLPIGLAVHYIDEGKATYMNRKFEEIYGWPREALEDIPRFFEKVYPNPQYREKIQSQILEDIQSGDPERMTWEGIEVTGRNGKKKIVSAKNIPIHDQNLMISTVQDITEYKRLEAQLQQSQKMEAIGTLAGGVAHDFNNKLSVIMGCTQLMLMDMQPEDPHYADLKQIQESAERSADLTRQLLAFARKQTIAPEPLNLNDMVEGMLKMLRRLMGEDIELAWQPDPKLWPVKMDPAQVDQILANLCVNARDAISGVGKVTIETKNAILDETYCVENAGCEPGEYVTLTVIDDGCGMDHGTLENVFEPFFTTKETGKGTGLGLSTVYGIAKQNQGVINVYSEPGKGSTFTIYIPRHYQEAGKKEAAAPAEAPGGQGETILVVEDDRSILNMAKKMLERLGYSVLTANSPDEAVHIARETGDEIHLLVTDVVMPKMSGKDLSEHLKASCAQIKTLFMSGYTADTIAHHGVLDEGVEFIEKPFSMNDLGYKVRAVLDKT